MDIIGKAKITNFDAFVQWRINIPVEFMNDLWRNHIHAKQDTELRYGYDNMFRYHELGGNWKRMTPEEQKELLHREAMDYCNKVKPYHEYIESTNQYWDVLFVSEDPNLILISYGTQKDAKFLVADWQGFLSYTPFKDYSDTPISELRQLMLGSATNVGGNGSLIPQNAVTNISVSDVQTGIAAKQAKLEELKRTMEQVQAGKTAEMAPLKAEIEALEMKLQAIMKKEMDRLNAIMAEYEAQKEQMERQIFILENEIYSIRCFLGETVHFVKIRGGKSAPIEEPIVLYQKLRYLNEDLGKFIIMCPNEPLSESLEESLARSDYLRDAFAPANKCITIIQLSESCAIYQMDEKVANTLKRYKMLHGHQIAILIRNGEALYIGWTDANKLSLRSDNFFLSPMKPKIEPVPAQNPGESDMSYRMRLDQFEKDMEAENKKNLYDGLTRHFLFSILNGVAAAENSILPLPKFANRMEQSQHILLSMADGALCDNRFGNFTDIIKRCNERVRKGDYILTVQSLRPESYNGKGYTGVWENSRGRGERNRTHDVRASDCTIYKVNLVEYDPPEKMKRYRYQAGTGTWYECITSEDSVLSEGTEVIEHFERIKQHTYISLEKEPNWRNDTDFISHANFEVFPEEYINLTYMASTWLDYILSTKQTQGWRVGGQLVDYAYALRYIGEALAFIRKREITEKENIIAAGGSHIVSDPDWPVAVAEWKMATGVRDLNAYQARRFVKAQAAT